MQGLEKILEEIEEKKKKHLDIVKIEVDPVEITIHREQYKGLRMAEDIIRKHINDGWIPVNDRLPEKEDDKVIVCNKQGNIDTGIYSPFTKQWFIGNISALSENVIAWRPLMEPYHSERSDNHDGE